MFLIPAHVLLDLKGPGTQAEAKYDSAEVNTLYNLLQKPGVTEKELRDGINATITSGPKIKGNRKLPSLRKLADEIVVRESSCNKAYTKARYVVVICRSFLTRVGVQLVVISVRTAGMASWCLIRYDRAISLILPDFVHRCYFVVRVSVTLPTSCCRFLVRSNRSLCTITPVE